MNQEQSGKTYEMEKVQSEHFDGSKVHEWVQKNRLVEFVPRVYESRYIFVGQNLFASACLMPVMNDNL